MKKGRSRRKRERENEKKNREDFIISTQESIVIPDVLLKPESRGNGRLLAAPVVYHNLPKRGSCRIVGQTLPE